MARRKVISVLTPADWYDRPHVFAAGKDARALYAVAQHHCASQLTDGRVARSLLPLLAAKAEIADPAAAAAKLEEAGLWAPDGDGWRDTEYLLHNWSRAEYEEYAEQRRQNGRKGGRPRKGARENQDANQDGFGEPPANHAVNHRANHDANQNGTKGVTKTEPSDRDRGSDRDLSHTPSQRERDQPANAINAREGAGARDSPNNVVPLRERQPPSKAFLRRTYQAFTASYPKNVPDHVKEIWAEHCYDEESERRIMAGLAAWRECRRWKEKGPTGQYDYAKAPRAFLEERLYDSRPLPDLDGAPPNGASHAEHRGSPQRPQGPATVAERINAGDVNDASWDALEGLINDRRPSARRRAGG